MSRATVSRLNESSAVHLAEDEADVRRTTDALFRRVYQEKGFEGLELETGEELTPKSREAIEKMYGNASTK